MIRRFISIMLPAVFLAAGCAQMEEPLAQEAAPSDSPLATECVNTVEKAADETLLLYLEEQTAL